MESTSALNTILSVIESPRPIVPPLNVTLPTNVDAPPTLKSFSTSKLLFKSTNPVTVSPPPMVTLEDASRVVTIPEPIVAVTISAVLKSTVVIVAAVPTISVMIPAVILAFTISPSTTSRVVIVAAVPTISVMIPAVILTSLRSAVSVSNTDMVAAVPTMSVTATPVMFIFWASKVSTSKVVIVP